MNYLEILYFVMQFSFWGYIIYVLIKYGVLPSVSDSYYQLPEKATFIPFKLKIENGKILIQHFKYIPSRELFRFFTLGFSLPAMMIGLTISEGHSFQFLVFLAASGIAFVGAAPRFKTIKLEERVHVIAALIGVICNTLYQFIVFPQHWYIPTIFVTIALPLLILKKHIKTSTYWIELLSFAAFSITIGVVLFS